MSYYFPSITPNTTTYTNVYINIGGVPISVTGYNTSSMSIPTYMIVSPYDNGSSHPLYPNNTFSSGMYGELIVFITGGLAFTVSNNHTIYKSNSKFVCTQDNGDAYNRIGNNFHRYSSAASMWTNNSLQQITLNVDDTQKANITYLLEHFSVEVL